MAVTSQGLSSPQAICEFLSQLKIHLCQEALASVAAARTHDEVMTVLEYHGAQLRLAKATTADDLQLVRTMALLEMANGSWILVQKKRNCWLVMDGGGRQFRSVSLSDFRRRFSQLSGTIIEQQPIRTANASQSFRDIIKTAILHQKRSICTLAALAIVLQALSLVFPLMLRTAVDQSQSFVRPSTAMTLGLAILAAGVFQAWVSWVQSKSLVYFQTNVDLTTRHELLTRLLNMPFAFLHQRSVGDLMKAFTSFGAIWEDVSAQSFAAVVNGAMAPVYMLLVALSMPAVSLVLFIATGLGVVLSYYCSRVQRECKKDEITLQSSQQSILVETLGGVDTIRSFGVERHFSKRWLVGVDKQFSAERRRLRAELWNDVLEELIANNQFAVVLLMACFVAMDRRASLGTVLAVVQFCAGYSLSAGRLLHSFRSLRVAIPQIETANEILRLPTIDRARSRARCHAGQVVVDKVFFRYLKDQQWVLRNQSLEVRQGMKVRIPGASGSGKTTLLRLLAGFYAPQMGTVRIDGHDPFLGISGLTYLPQFVQIFSGSIWDNLRILSGHASADCIMKAAEDTGLNSWIKQLPMRFETMLSAGAGTLSGGQRQLIALTAVAASQSRLLLLDEAMANLDPASQSKIFDSDLFRDKTVIYTSHSEEMSSLKM